jgi:Ca-activated chloride channel family protein
LDGAEKLVLGEPVDIAWFSHGKYISLLQGQNRRIVAQEKIMLSPVVMGVKMSKAKQWGWLDKTDLTWRDIADKAKSGELKYAMTNPASSNSGFTATVGVTAAFSNKGDVISAQDVDKQALKDFFEGQKLIAGSSGWLAEAYVKEQDRLDGIINYESVLMQLNDSGQLQEKLHLVYPSEGIITADYPIMLMNSAKRDDFNRLVEFLKIPEFQRTLMQDTQRRPVIPQVKLSDRFPKQILVELPFPSKLETINEILFAYLDEHRRPSHAFLVLDVSGSMQGARIHSLQGALANLTGLDTSITGQFSRFRSREKITMITFNNNINKPQSFTITDTDPQGTSMREIRTYVDGLKVSGGTAIFSALRAAYVEAQKARSQDPDRFYSIVLMSDGENNNGISRNQFLQFYDSLPADAKQIKTFPILFGEANVRDMEVLAERTGGRVFDGRKSLSQIFKKIRGYQ